MIYFINFGILLFFAIFVDLITVKQFKNYEKNIYILLSLYLIFFVGFREDTGFDYNTYKNIFNQISNLSFIQLIHSNFFGWIEPGYIFLNYFLGFLSFEKFLFIASLIAMIPKLIYIYRFCESKMLALLFYYSIVMIFLDMGILRQAIAIGFCFWGYQALNEKNIKKFIIITFFASMFHTISLIMILLLLLRDKNISYKFYIITIILAFGVSLIHPMKLITQIVSMIGGSYISDKINYYAYNYSAIGDTSQTIYLSVLKRLITMILFMILISKRAVEEENKRSIFIYLNAFYLSIILSLLVIDIPIIAGRGTSVFQVVQMFIFTELLNVRYSRINMKSVIGYKTLVFLISMVLAIYSFHGIAQSEVYLPYMNYFF